MSKNHFLLEFAIFFCSLVAGISSTNGTDAVPECKYAIRSLTQSSMFTKDGYDFPTKSQMIIIKDLKEVGCVLRMSEIAFPAVEKQILVYAFMCFERYRVILDTENVTSISSNIAYLQSQRCSFDKTEVSKLEKLYDLKVLTFFDTGVSSRDWMGVNSTSTDLDSIREVLAFTIISQRFVDHLPWILETNETFPTIAEMSLTGLGLSELPPDMHVRFPNLQSLELAQNSFTHVPPFPYTENLAYLPLNLSRTLNMQNHYANSIGIEIARNVVRRILDMNNNLIEYLPDYFVNGTLQQISISSNRLTNISDHAFDLALGLELLQLKNNLLVTINDEVFSECKKLRRLELSGNKIHWIHSGAFRHLSNLRQMDLSFNDLTRFEPGTFYPLDIMESLNLESNYIDTFNKSVLSSSTVKLKTINLSRNKFQSLPVLFFLLRGLEMVNLSHCQISIDKMSDVLDLIPEAEFIDSIVSSASASVVDLFAKREKKRKINLKNNLIRRLDFSEFNKIREKMMIVILLNFELILTGNPIECDCHLVSLLDFFAKTRSEKRFDGTEYFYRNWLCHSPPEFKGRPLLSLEKGDLYCREKLTRCPTDCTCYRRYVSKVVIADCSNRNFTSLPENMPDGQLEIWLQNNNISKLEQRNYLPRIEILKLENNLISDLNVPVFKRMTSIKKLYFEENLLTTLPNEIKEINFELLVIDANHLVCDCHNHWMKHWLMSVQNRVQNWSKIQCSTSEDKVSNIVMMSDEEFICVEEANFKRTLALGLSLGIAILIVLICLYLLFYYKLEVKVLIYIYFNLHPFDCDPQKIDDDKEPIDTLVICSKSMIEWVTTNVTETLESLRFNVLDINRDFLIGMSVSENMRMAVSRSKRSIVILSMESLNDPTINLALTFTHEKVLRERPTYMVLFLHDVKKDVIDKDNQDLKKYLSSGRYIRTGDSMRKEKMLYMLTGSTTDKKENMELRRKKSYKLFFPEIMNINLKTSFINYDIFISYPDPDYQFSTGVLFPALHARGYRVCLPDRDFLVGSSKEENILYAIERSRRTMVIISENHVEDEWQLFTLRTAIERSLKETSNYLLCVLDPNVDVSTLDPETKAFLSTHVIIYQDDPMFWQKLFRSFPPPAFKENDPDMIITPDSTHTSKSVLSIT